MMGSEYLVAISVDLHLVVHSGLTTHFHIFIQEFDCHLDGV